MAAPDEQEDGELSSYSVSFHIEKQEDQPDSTSCAAVTSADLETLPEDCSKICLLKGSYPAIAVTRPMKSVIRTEQFRRTFMAVPFAEWLKEQSQHCRIDLNPAIVRSVKLCQNILKTFDMWPEDEMDAAREAQEKKEQEEYELAAEMLKEEIAEQRTMVDQALNELFRLRVGDPAHDASNTSLQTALTAYEAFREWIKSTCLWKIDEKIPLTLDAPGRLGEVGGKLFVLYSCGDTADLSKLLEMCATTSTSELLKAIKNRKAKESNPEVDIEANEDSWEIFVKRLSEPLAKLQTKWRIGVESVLAAANEIKL